MTRITIPDEIELEFEHIRTRYNIPYMTKPLDLIKFLILKTRTNEIKNAIEIAHSKKNIFTEIENLHKTLPKTQALNQEEINKLLYEEAAN